MQARVFRETTNVKVMIMKRITILVISLATGLLATSAQGQGGTVKPPAADSGPQPCIDVTVNGYKTPSYDCLTQQMTPQPPAGGVSAGLASGAVANTPSNQLGLANVAAFRNRMGNTAGTSVHPQRPAPSPASPLMQGR